MAAELRGWTDAPSEEAPDDAQKPSGSFSEPSGADKNQG